MSKILCIPQLIIIILIVLNSKFYAQEVPTDSLVTLSLQDGTILSGTIIKQDSASITVRSLDGIDIKVNNESVITIIPYGKQPAETEFFRSEPNYSRLLFGPTGRTLKKGEAYLSVLQVFFVSLSYGITDNVTLNGGVSYAFWSDFQNQWFFIGTKVKVITMESSVISGGVAISSINGDKSAIFYGVSSTGSNSASLSLGLGYGFSEGKTYGNPIFLIGGEIRLGTSVKLISENWVFGKMDPFTISAALQFLTNNMAFDVGIAYYGKRRDEKKPTLPWLGFTYNF